MARLPALPDTLPSGELVLHMSAKRRHEIIDIAFEHMGGMPRLVHEFGRNGETYREFMTKLWVKGLPRVSNMEHTMSAGIESLVDQADEADRFDKARVINGTALELEPEDDS